MLKHLLVLMFCFNIPVLKGFSFDFLNPVNYIFGDKEKCDVDFVYKNATILQSKLKTYLFGQHFANEKLVAVIDNHVRNEPKKALVICMHGWTGGGKNYATDLILRSLYRLGGESKFVHYFSGRLHFPLASKEAVLQYGIQLQEWVRGNVTLCPRSTFVFDEIDKIPSQVIDYIKPYFDYYTSIDSVDYRKSIFIFLSNLGGNSILKKYIELWKQGIPREKMEYKEFEPVLRNVIYNSEGAFEKSSILQDHLVSLYLPFLPLEKEHVEKCIVEEIIRQDLVVRDKDVQSVLNEMEFYKGRFSISGCKRVVDQVAMLAYTQKTEL